MYRKASDLTDFSIQATDGEIGHVHDLFFDDSNWAVRYIVVDTGPWLFGRRVLLSPEVLGSVEGRTELLHVNITQEQVKSSPPVDLEKPISRQYESVLHQYYRWTPYWGLHPGYPGGIGASGVLAPIQDKRDAGAAVAEASQESTEDDVDPNLRSINEVIGYHIQATDDEVGHVEDILVDTSDWIVRYMLVDTRNWLPGREVLISPDWIDRISWRERKVHVGVDRQRVEDSPEYNPKAALDRSYERDLWRHYGIPGYWI